MSRLIAQKVAESGAVRSGRCAGPGLRAGPGRGVGTWPRPCTQAGTARWSASRSARRTTAEPGTGRSPRSPRWRTEAGRRSEEHTSELQSLRHLVCRLLLEKKKTEL